MVAPSQSGGAVDPAQVAYVAAFAVATLACFASLRRVDRVEDPDTRRGLAGLLATSCGWSAAHVGFLAAPGEELRLACYYAGLVVGSDLRFRADPGRLRQLLENLFRNAVEHGGAQATVTVGERADGDGSGIPAADRESVFEFGETSTASGSGLGLAIVATIADAHGWERRVTEAEDGGARFEFWGVDATGE